MTGRIADWLLDRSRRERWLLGLLLALGLPAAALFLAILPLTETAARAAQEAETARALRDWVAARGAEAALLAPAAAEIDGEPIGISLLDRSLREAGLRDAVDQLANRGDGEVELGFDQVRFTQLAAWMDRMAPAWGYEIATLRIDRGDAGDLVAARLVLRPAG